MTSDVDVLTRARRVLGIEDEPVARPPVLVREAGQPAASFLDKAKIADVLKRAAAASTPPATSPASQPQNVMRRVEIMMTGTVSRVGVVRAALHDLQAQLFREVGGDHLELRLTAFLDGCRHTTPWSRSPVDVGNNTTIWHCFQGETRYSEALGHSANEPDPIDAIVMFGDRFDDNLAHSLGIADRLKKQGTRIYAFPVGGNRRSRNAYQQLAESTGGTFLQLSDQRAFARVMPVIADYLLRPAEALRALPAPKDADVKALVDKLKLQPPPAASLRLTWRKS
jgi:hypothetical protein